MFKIYILTINQITFSAATPSSTQTSAQHAATSQGAMPRISSVLAANYSVFLVMSKSGQVMIIRQRAEMSLFLG
jgi:hypothetical protein